MTIWLFSLSDVFDLSSSIKCIDTLIPASEPESDGINRFLCL